MQQCGTCRYWRLNPQYEDFDPLCQPEDDHGDLIDMPFEVRECLHPERVYDNRPTQPDGFGVTGRLVTGPAFGCPRGERRTYGEAQSPPTD